MLNSIVKASRCVCGQMMTTDTKAETPREGRRRGWFPRSDDGSHCQLCRSVIRDMERRKSQKVFGFEAGGPTDVRAVAESIEAEANETLDNFDQVRVEVEIVGQNKLQSAFAGAVDVGEQLDENDHKVQE